MTHEDERSAALEFGRRVQEHRRARGWTVKALGDRCVPAIARPNVARIESGAHLPRLDTAIRLARALGTPLDVLVGGLEAV